MQEQVEFSDLNKAREILSVTGQPVVLINAPGTIRFLGALVIDQMFKTLSKEFVIKKVIFRVDDDIPGLFQAIELKYSDILYTGKSVAAQHLLKRALSFKSER
jgi:hypothetical protein